MRSFENGMDMTFVMGPEPGSPNILKKVQNMYQRTPGSILDRPKTCPEIVQITFLSVENDL